VADVQPYADFFDRHGTANDRLLAHYLLGRAYYEAGEAPMALQCYQQAAECADTTAEDCDYKQLCRVYAQIGDLFYYQGLYREAVQPTEKAVHYADLAGDSLIAVTCYEQLSFIYDALNISDTAILIMEKAANRYRKLGYESDAAISLGSIARPLILAGKLEKASQYMSIYESGSGFFDKGGNIQSGREAYYNSKGLLCLKKGLLDSAKYWFHKEIAEGHDFNNQNGGAYGLAKVYAEQHRYDSAARFFQYAYDMNDSMHIQRNSDVVERIHAIYNYSRNQEIARKKSEEAQIEKAHRQTIFIVFVVFAIVCLLTLYRLVIKQKQGLEKYRQSLEELHVIRNEKKELIRHKEEYSKMIAEKDKKIQYLERITHKYGKQLFFTTANAERCIKESPTYQELSGKAVKGMALTDQDWNSVLRLIKEYLPGFDDFMATHQYKLRDREYKMCLLFRLHFKAVDIAGALDISKSKISQASSEIMKKLYQEKGSSKELHAKLSELF
jgi:tetratricopeptide (TPR) repeat protein